MKRMHKFLPLLLIIFSLPIMWGIFHPGFFVSDDGHWMIIRLSAFYEALTSGQFPVRFLPRLNEGLGYPVADFLYPLFLYVGSLLHILRIPFVLDVKIILGVSVITSGVGMYIFLKKNFSSFASFFGGLLFMYLPYHLYDLFNRGSVGEIVSLGVVPFLFWAIEKKSWTLSSIFLGLLILAHNSLAIFFFPVAVMYAYVGKMSIRHIVLFSGFGLGLAAFFWIPALFDKQFTIFDTVIVSNPFNYFVNTVSYQLAGWIMLAIFGGIFFTKKPFKEKSLLFFIILGISSLFLSFSISSIFWKSKVLAEFVQFPFRFLSLTLLCESFLGAYLVEHFKQKIILTSVLSLLLVFSSLPYLFPTKYDYQNDSFYATNAATTTVQNEYMPRWLVHIPTAYMYQKIVLPKEVGSITITQQKGTALRFASDTNRDSNVVIAFAYFPGWFATIDGRKVSLAPSNTGMLQLRVPKGHHVVHIWFGETWQRVFADIASILSVALIVLFLIKKRYEK
ncbi:MAG TPA: hypothetical protein VLB73_02200 [Patescibacteria group bacterium]|nr:hypothetical protein [Patescibacteria group bacterium]